MISGKRTLSTIFQKTVNRLYSEFFEQYCFLCAERHSGPLKTLCLPCYRNMPFFVGSLTLPAHVHALFSYDFPINRILPRFKYRQQLKWQKLILELFRYRLAEHNLTIPTHCDWIISVPMSRQKKGQRGFNQSELLATITGQVLGIPHRSDLVHKPRQTRAQASLSKSERQQNLLSSFAVCPGAQRDIKGSRILIVDDVTTTGATLSALKQLLIEQGAEDVFGLCLAATPGPEWQGSAHSEGFEYPERAKDRITSSV